MEFPPPPPPAPPPGPPPLVVAQSIWHNWVPTTLKRTASFVYSKRTSTQVNTYIMPGLFLGMIPHNGPDEIIDFVKIHDPHHPLGLIVSVVEPDELEGKGFLWIKTVSYPEWRERGIEPHLMPMRDFTAEVNVQEGVNTLLKMRACIENGQSLFIHCKAGRSRSAMFLIAYLCLYVLNPKTDAFYTVEEGIQFLESKRPEVSIDEGKRKTAENLISAFRAFVPESLQVSSFQVSFGLPSC